MCVCVALLYYHIPRFQNLKHKKEAGGRVADPARGLIKRKNLNFGVNLPVNKYNKEHNLIDKDISKK